eukprot:TRINITY_DN8535_c0_g1_i1.p2 TRINITY_DN8535_c0_g1~~TRINITY_DN8535_c0_g1_i1.p2  ORF type:complete len:367 (-),score=75.93 TRINITY_DN8535_c0_g1_i1:311-1411(-)
MPLETVRHCEVAKCDIQLFYDTFGDKATGDPILLIMGLGTQMIGWREPFCEKLAARGMFVVRFDNRDVGLSSHLDHLGAPNILAKKAKMMLWMKPPSVYSLHDMAADAVALMDKLGIPAAHVAGASMGGMIAQRIAIDFPSRVKSLTSIMSTTGDPGLPQASLGVQLKMVKKPPPDLEGRVKHSVWLFSHIWAKKHFNEAEAEKYVRAALARSDYREGSARQLDAITSAPGRGADLAKLRIPALVVHGTEDPLVPPPCGLATHAHLAGSELLMLDDMAHDLPAPHYDTVIEAMMRAVAKARAGIVPEPKPIAPEPETEPTAKEAPSGAASRQPPVEEEEEAAAAAAAITSESIPDAASEPDVVPEM